MSNSKELDDESSSEKKVRHKSEVSLPSTFMAHMAHTEMDLNDEKWDMAVYGKPNSKWVGSGRRICQDIPKLLEYEQETKAFHEHWSTESSVLNESARRVEFFNICSSYHDVFHLDKNPFYLGKEGQEEDSDLRDAYIMHVFNHICHTRDLQNYHDSFSGSGRVDQGFTRPKVLILLPLQSMAMDLFGRFLQLTPRTRGGQDIDNFFSFNTREYIDVEDQEVIPRSEMSVTSFNFLDCFGGPAKKPSDFHSLFGGNNNDRFMVGLEFMGNILGFRSHFKSADIMVASPLELSNRIDAAEFNDGESVDYLSSIEILIIDHADVISMQNWTRVNYILQKLNNLPSIIHRDTDLTRIRPWFIHGNARKFRQTIVLGHFDNPQMRLSFKNHCFNYEGKIEMVTEFKGVLPKVILPVEQVYKRFDADSFMESHDARLDCFMKNVYPKIEYETGTVILVSSYDEFMKVFDFLSSKKASFCILGEYVDSANIKRAREWFFSGHKDIMLCTERFHFHNRDRIHGMKSVIMYSLPERKDFYCEFLNMTAIAPKDYISRCTVLYCKWDAWKLKRIVGESHSKRLITSGNNTFVFK